MVLSVMSKKRIAVASVGAGVNLLLFFVKLYIGLSVNSVAIYADALNSVADCAVCIAATVGFYIVSANKSEKYPFGLGKSEELINILISVVILATGGAFAYISLERLMYPVPVWYSTLYAAIIAATAAVKLGLVFFFKVSAKKLGSDSIKGISTDSLLDFFVTLCTLISFTLSSVADFSLDGAAGLVISIVLLAEGVKMTVSACKTAIGRRNDELCDRVKTLLETENEIEKIIDIQCHSYGKMKVFTADVSVNCKSADEITAISERLNEKVRKELDAYIYFGFGGEK